MSSSEYGGLWHLPNGAHRVPGTLRLSEGELRLNLEGTLDADSAVIPAPPHTLILGQTYRGDRVTCWKPELTNQTLGRAAQTQYSVRAALIGAHVSSEEAFRFAKLDFRLTHLTDWVDRTGLSASLSLTPDGPQFASSYRLPDTIHASTSRGQFSLTYARTFNIRKRRAVNISEEPTILVESASPLPLEEWDSTVLTHWRMLLSLATGMAHHLTWLSAKVLEGAERDTSEDMLPILLPSMVPPDPNEEDLHPRSLLFRLSDIRDDLGNALDRWFAAVADVSLFCDFFFGTQYAEALYLRQRFFDLVSGLEAYHRVRGSTQYRMPTAEHEERMNRLASAVSHDYSEWLKDALSLSNQPSLKTRLMELLDGPGATLKPLCRPKVQNFAQRVVHTRNYLAHGLVELDSKTLTGEALYWATEVLQLLARACLLSELGINAEKRDTLIQAVDTYSRIVQRQAHGGLW